MRREKIGQIVNIGGGLCRVIVRSEKLARRLAELPDVELHDEDSKHLGWWLIFPERLRPAIEPLFRQKTVMTRKPAKPEQLSFLPDDTQESAEPGSANDADNDDARSDTDGEDSSG